MERNTPNRRFFKSRVRRRYPRRYRVLPCGTLTIKRFSGGFEISTPRIDVDGATSRRDARRDYILPRATMIRRHQKSIDSTEAALCRALGSSRGTCLEFTISGRSAQSNSIPRRIEITWQTDPV